MRAQALKIPLPVVTQPKLRKITCKLISLEHAKVFLVFGQIQLTDSSYFHFMSTFTNIFILIFFPQMLYFLMFIT